MYTYMNLFFFICNIMFLCVFFPSFFFMCYELFILTKVVMNFFLLLINMLHFFNKIEDITNIMISY